jgi:hypothetical protein
MICCMGKKRGPFGAHWLLLATTGVLFALVATFVDLKSVFNWQTLAMRIGKKAADLDYVQRCG